MAVVVVLLLLVVVVGRVLTKALFSQLFSCVGHRECGIRDLVLAVARTTTAATAATTAAFAWLSRDVNVLSGQQPAYS